MLANVFTRYFYGFSAHIFLAAVKKWRKHFRRAHNNHLNITSPASKNDMRYLDTNSSCLCWINTCRNECVETWRATDVVHKSHFTFAHIARKLWRPSERRHSFCDRWKNNFWTRARVRVTCVGNNSIETTFFVLFHLPVWCLIKSSVKQTQKT